MLLPACHCCCTSSSMAQCPGLQGHSPLHHSALPYWQPNALPDQSSDQLASKSSTRQQPISINHQPWTTASSYHSIIPSWHQPINLSCWLAAMPSCPPSLPSLFPSLPFSLPASLPPTALMPTRIIAPPCPVAPPYNHTIIRLDQPQCFDPFIMIDPRAGAGAGAGSLIPRVVWSPSAALRPPSPVPRPSSSSTPSPVCSHLLRPLASPTVLYLPKGSYTYDARVTRSFLPGADQPRCPCSCISSTRALKLSALLSSLLCGHSPRSHRPTLVP